MKWPRHLSLSLHHNDHRNVYERVEERYEDKKFGDWDFTWVSEEQKAKAIETQDVWELHWYPDTPIGSCSLLACDLDVLLAAAAEE